MKALSTHGASTTTKSLALNPWESKWSDEGKSSDNREIISQLADSAKSNLYDFKKILRISTLKSTPQTWQAESLDFDSLRTKIFTQRTKSKASKSMEWVAYALIGTFTGLTSACMMGIEEFLVHEKRHLTDFII